MSHGRPLSMFLLVLTTVWWGSTYVVTKGGLDQIPPMRFALLRFSVASLLLVVVALARGGLSRLPRPTPWGTLTLMALTGIASYYVGFNLALTYTSASQGALVQSASPAVTAMAAVWLLGERVTRRRLLGIALAIGGVLLIVARGTPDANAPSPLIGNLLMFGTVVLWSVYTVFAKRLANADPAVVMAVVSCLGTVMLIPPALTEAARTPVAPISVESWLRIIYLGAFPSAAGFLLYSRALRDLDATQAGIFINLVPVIGAVSGVVVLGDSISPMALVGGVLVLGGIWVSSKS
jgi:drug/metabolite transporter (DMT)-like permease